MKAINYSLLVVFLFFYTSCQKDFENEAGKVVQTNPVLIDSIIIDNHLYPGIAAHFIYDNQNRVVEERVTHNDTLKNRRLYEYIGNDSLPYKKIYYKKSNSFPEFASFFQYDNSGQKIYDSTYALPAGSQTGYTVTSLDYSIPKRIVVKMKVGWNLFLFYQDTVFLNSNANIDSIQNYHSTNFVLSATSISNYDARINPLKLLSISQCKFYETFPNQGGGYTAPINGNGYISGMGSDLRDDVFQDYFNKNLSLRTSYYIAFKPDFAKQHLYQFNVDNLPIALKTTVPYSGAMWEVNTRIVYK